ncbi:cob(I)yrinic acid a,c-diamide adenosyltransferase [Endomicrobium proavitum]|uniref:corrinoid adenosyltransferase n=1 Tax=Endomicrobium proavitum TaxID=1408281 RepID=A0A0G3WHG8_9BACT|nr:cob(I)yrinic acid a,c-diamide adenosyltransferase [Endomicrobium proavitum]AKL97773.1 Cob(I)alamin adenosyltransferase [Endomicrobium proavitum]
MLIVNTGEGKGKTTAAIGQIIRALGQGFSVCLIQLFKGESFYGEQKILTKLDNLDFFSFAKEHPYCIENVTLQEASEKCKDAFNKLSELSNEPKKYDLVVLEEFNIALRDKFMEKNATIDLIKKLSEKSNVIVTGRGAPQELIAIADLVTEMKEIKHPYNKGVKAQRGIEF